jgi:choline dehydrogenase-like flavoprotein
MKTQFDAVIIGSGAGGAPIAHTLVKAGKSVLVLEKGPLFQAQYQNQTGGGLSDWKRDEQFPTGAEKRVNLTGIANGGQSYYNSHVEPDLNDEPHIYRDADNRDRVTIEGYTAQVVGGGTQIYGAVSLRFTETDLRLKSFNEGRNDLRNDPNGDVPREARDWPISYQDLEPYYCKAEALIGINGTRTNQLKPFACNHYQKPLTPNPISSYAHTGMELLGQELTNGGKPVLPYRTPLAVITEDHAPSGRKGGDPMSGYVNRYGDPMGFKSSTYVSLLYPLQREHPDLFTLWTNCNVTHLESNGSRVSRVHFRDPGGNARTVEGKIVVVACSAIESVRLLKLSGLADSAFEKRMNGNGLLGKYFLTHCFGGAETAMPVRCDKSRSLDSDWAIDCCATEEFLRANGLWAGAALYNNTSDQALPVSMARTHGSQDLDTIWKAFVDDTSLTGEKLVEFFDQNFGNRLSVSFMANQVPLPTNRIELHPTVRDKWGRPVAYIIKDWHPHDKYLMDVMAQQCAKVLRYGGDPVNRNYPVEGFGGVYQAENALARIANHILGGARFGTDPNDSVLDPDCKAWNFDNLYVTDGCFMPTSGGANPTLTIEANSFRVADILVPRV